MRIRQLKFNNVNSFIGTFSIDFSRFENELFLISGPTGSGKTTIIDAILAALYNKTPRLTFANDLLNKNSKEGWIELGFELKGEEYRITWKAKKNKDRIEVKRHLYKNGELIADKNVNEKVENILTLGFEDFTKSIVLAQGEFDAFLSANSSQKSRFLEKILDVSEYEKISIKVFEKNKRVRQKMEELKQKIDNIKAVDEDLKILEGEKREKKSQLEKIKKSRAEVEEKLKLQNEKKRILIDKEDCLIRIDSLKKEIDEFDKKSFIKRYKEQKTEFEKYEKKVLKEIRELEEEVKKDIALKGLLNQDKRLQNQLKEIKENIKYLQEQVKKDETLIENLEKKLANITLFKDAALQNYDRVFEIVTSLKALRKEYKKEDLNIKELKKELEKNKKSLKQNSVEELRKELEYLEAKLLVLKYEKDRELLEDGSPCPLCGSLEHPYTHNLPDMEEGLKSRYEELKEDIETKEKEAQELRIRIEKNSSLLQEAQNRKENIMQEDRAKRELLKRFGIKEDDFEKLKEKKEHNERENARLQNLNAELSAKKSALDQKRESIKKDQKRALELQNEIDSIKAEIEGVKLKIQNPSRTKREKEREYKEKKDIWESIKREFDEKIKELAKKESLLVEKEDQLRKLEKRLEKIDIDDFDYESQKENLSKQIEELSNELGQLTVKIDNTKAHIEERRSLISSLESLSKEARILEKLDKAIGSSDGKKFKQLALNKMIDSLIFVTNQHLKELSQGRYLLAKSGVERVDMEIIDTFGQNSKRGVNTLSGGEKFLVSLALSFGLSDMVRNRVKIDTMFLDEGFGTLDPQTLARTMEVLKRAGRGKSIGIISHIESIKEDIGLGIEVKKRNASSSCLKVI